MMRPLIVCGFPGVGKTACEKYKRVLDAESSAYSHNFDPATNEITRNDIFPKNYIDMVEKEIEYDNYDIILLSCHKCVRDELKRRGIEYVVVVPYTDCKNEYMIRYLRRGSDCSFMNEMFENWERYISEIVNPELRIGSVPTIEDVPAVHGETIVRLEKGMYISEILPIF